MNIKQSNFDIEHRTERRIQFLELQISSIEKSLREGKVNKTDCLIILNQILTEVEELKQDIE